MAPLLLFSVSSNGERSTCNIYVVNAIYSGHRCAQLVSDLSLLCASLTNEHLSFKFQVVFSGAQDPTFDAILGTTFVSWPFYRPFLCASSLNPDLIHVF